MDFLLNILSDPRVLSLLSLPVACMIVEAWALYKLFNMNNTLQEKRLEEAKRMNLEYTQLATDINKTLDLVVKLSGKRNGNGGTTSGQ